ncbi:hypothetical protein [Candidatus Entotheonella palauensis]|uniref:hypothetical protein n=1 Tax=Candidatus Entotheonella palauensis TaxID=93172 RepID=UPI0015C41F0A|nr:hypothetical protein [Candidatus Entotheonella palauensis]
MPTLAVVTAVLFGLISPGMAEANLLLTEPVHGSFTTASQTVASGRVEMADLSDVVLTVNGMAVTPAADGSFSHPVALDAERIFNPVLVELTASGNIVARRRPVVIVGPSLFETALAPEGLAVRLTDRGLDQLELLVLRAVDLDLAMFLPPGPLFTEEVCLEIPVLPDICIDVEVTINDNPAPRIGSVDIDLDAVPNQLNLQLMLRDLFVSARVEADGVSCTMTVTADSMMANGAIRLEPGAADPAAIDVMQAGNIAITFGNFNTNTDCGGILGDVLAEFIDLLEDNVRDLLQDGLEDFLNAVDAAGNTPLADILEDVLGMLSLEDVLNDAIAETGLQARIPFSRISEDSGGITFAVDTSVGARPESSCTTSQDNPALAAVYDIPQPLPVLGTRTPGGLLFDAGGAVSSTVLNQALRGVTACELLQAEFTDIDIDGTPTPITAGLLGAFLPAFDQLDPAQPLRVVLRPTLAPVVSGTPGPAGELLDLRVSSYLVEVFIPDDPSPLMQLSLDTQAGIDVLLDTATGGLRPRIGDVADLSAILLINPLGVDSSRIDFFIDLLLPQVDDLNDDPEPFEIPSVEGIDFEIVEVSPIGTYLGVFLDFMVQPGAFPFSRSPYVT